MIQSRAYAAFSPTAPLGPHTIIRRDPQGNELTIAIAYCGVCHTDIHCARDEWGGQPFPVVPGHEITGVVTAIGPKVTRFTVGATVGVGCMVDSCGDCPPCRHDLEQHCLNGTTFTYGSPFTHGAADPGAPHTLGGYSEFITVSERFVVSIPQGLDLAPAAPLLCAGITTYSPLKRFGAGPGRRVGIVGLGGLGHLAVKIARAMGAEVTVITTSPSKIKDAHALGAHSVIISSDDTSMKRAIGSLDLIIDAVGSPHELDRYLNLLAFEGTLALVGAPAKPFSIGTFDLSGGRRNLTASLIGGIAETQEMLDFCAAHGIDADIEIIPISAINSAYERMLRSDVKYRFVIDVKSLAVDG